jgi:hypothetical protein
LLIGGKDLQKPLEVFNSIRIPIALEIFDEYLGEICYDEDNAMYSVGVPEAFWSAMAHAHKHQDGVVVEIPKDLKEKWAKFKTGFRKMRAENVIEEGLSVYEGKDSLSRLGYRELQKLALDPQYATPDQMLWVPAINAASRNLVQRVNSVGQLTFGIFHWKQDCMCITLSRQGRRRW